MFGSNAVVKTKNAQTGQTCESRSNRTMRGGGAGDVAASVQIQDNAFIRFFRRNPLAAHTSVANRRQAKSASPKPLINRHRTKKTARSASYRLLILSPFPSPDKQSDACI